MVVPVYHDWREVQLGDVVTLQRGKDLPADKRGEGPYPVIGSNGIVGYHAEFVAYGPGVSVGRSGSVGKVTWIDQDYWPLNTSLWVSDFHENDPGFVYYLLDYLDLGRYTAGVSVPTLNRNLVHPLKIAIPALTEQRAIAHTLRTVQDAIQARRRELALERERKASLMQHLFTHGTRGEVRKLTPIGEMPESWQVCELRQIAQIAYGLTVNESRRTSRQRAPYLTVANVTRGALRLEEVKDIGMVAGDADNYRLYKGDVLLVEGNGNPRLLGSAAMWNDELPFVLHQNHLIRARPDTSVVLSEWVMNYLNSDAGRAQLLGKAKTSSGLHSINSRIIAGLQIPLPPLVEQTEIANVISACDIKVAAIERDATLLDELFRAMLEDLMSGCLSAVPLIEPEAEAILV